MTNDPTPDTPTPGPVFARLDRPQSDPAVTLAVVADPHVAIAARGTWKVYHRTLDRLRTAVAVANEHADAALLAGDLTRRGDSAEFDAVDDALADLDVPWWAVPGNHDVPKSFDETPTPPVRRFTDRYNSLPFAAEVGDLTLLGVDTATGESGGTRPNAAVDGGVAETDPEDTTDSGTATAATDLADTWGGRVGPAQRAWLAEHLADADRPVVLLHHPVAALPECPAGDRWRNFFLQDDDSVAGLLREHDTPLVVSGHHHVPAVRTLGPTTELLAPPACSFPQAAMLVEITPDGTTLRLVPLTDRDGVDEAHGLARNGEILGQTVCELAERRLADHVTARTDRE